MALQLIEWDGQPITRPGIYSGVPIETYHDDAMLFAGAPHISSGGLRAIEDPEGSLAHFWHGYVMNPDREKPEPGAHFSQGQACHTLFLGEDGFREKFIIRPETYTDDRGVEKPWSSNATICKAWLKKQADDGKTVLKAEDLEAIKRMAAKLAAHPTIAAGLLNGLVEKSIFWFRDVVLEDGQVQRVWLKARPDVLTTDSHAVVDYKTCASADPMSVRRSITDFGYHQQLALIQEGLWEVAGHLTTDHYLVFQEKKEPYEINIKPLFGSAIHVGHMQNARALQRFAKCWADREWPGYADDECSCDLMEWRVKQLKEEIKDGRLNEDIILPGQIPHTPPPVAALPAPKIAPAMPELEEV